MSPFKDIGWRCDLCKKPIRRKNPKPRKGRHYFHWRCWRKIRKQPGWS